MGRDHAAWLKIMGSKAAADRAARGPLGNVMGWRAALLVVLSWGLSALPSVQGQDLGAPIITNFEPEKYKGHYQNWMAIQDRRGILYFGNTDGILEFDGQHWRHISTPTISSIRALAAGSDGTIYYGGNGDLGHLTVSSTGQVTAKSLLAALPEGERAFSDVLQILTGNDGIYFLTRTKVFRFNGGRITTISCEPAPSQSCLLNGTLFFADTEKGLCLLDGDRVVPIPQLAGLYDGKRIVLAPFGPHELLLGRTSGNFRRIDLSSLWDEASRRYLPNRTASKTAVIQNFPTEVDALISESNPLLYRLVPLGPKAFAIATLQSGIIIFDRTGKITRAINKASGLLDNTVTGLFLDRAQNLWATLNAGISHIELSVPQSTFGARNGIEGVSLTAGFHKGRLYVSTFQNLFVQTPYRYTLESGLPKFVAVQNGPREIWQFLEVNGDFLAASGRGLFQIQGSTAFRVPGSADTTCMSLSVSRRWPNHLFVGRMGGMDVFRRTSAQWAFLGRLEGVTESIRSVTEDSNGDLWLSTDAKKLLRAHFHGNKPTEVTVQEFATEHSLRGLRAFSHGTTLFAASTKGLLHTTVQPWRNEGPNEVNFAPEPSLGKAFDNPLITFSTVFSDRNGGFFFLASSGVIWALPSTGGQYEMITKPFQGLPGMTREGLLHSDGSVWLPGRVLHRIEPLAAKNYDQPFAVLIRKVFTKAKRTVFEGTYGFKGTVHPAQQTVFTPSQGASETPELPFKENALAFEFSATFFEKPGTTQFQYLLEGFEKDWSEWTAGTSKEYTYLKEGNYRFRVRAKNLYGTVGQESSYRFRILAPWYRTPWAYLLWFTCGSLGLLGAVYLYTRRLHRQKAILAAQVAARTAELSTVNDRLYRLNDEKNRIIGVAAHDLRSPLSGILLACDLMADEPGVDHTTTIQAIARQGHRMVELIQGLLDVNAIEANSAERPSLTSLDPIPWIESACRSLAVRAEKKGITLDADLGPPGIMLYADGRHVARVMDNLLSNAVKYSPPGSHVQIRRVEEAQHSVFRVQDQGPGLTPEDQQRLFQTYARLSAQPTAGESSVGLGLSIVKKLVEGMDGQVWAESSPGKGATFCVRLPRG